MAENERERERKRLLQEKVIQVSKWEIVMQVETFEL